MSGVWFVGLFLIEGQVSNWGRGIELGFRLIISWELVLVLEFTLGCFGWLVIKCLMLRSTMWIDGVCLLRMYLSDFVSLRRSC